MVRVPVARRTRSPFADMNRMARELDSLFGDWNSSRELWSPTVDVEETAEALLFAAELPGMDHDEIDIELEDGVLTIQGEKKEERKDEGTQGLLYERRWGAFTRRFTLPRAVDADGITATHSNGILRIRVPKADEAKGRKIRITAGDNGNGGRDVSVES